jgi:hypothetical protein
MIFAVVEGRFSQGGLTMGMKLYLPLRTIIYRLVAISALFTILGILGCASTPSLHSRSMDFSSDKIFISTQTIHLRGPLAVIHRELGRYTCSPNNRMWCDISADLATCNCVRK